MAPSQATKVRTRTSVRPTVTKQPALTTTNAVPAISSKALQEISVSSAQLVDQRQSQELAQTLVHGSVSCIAYLRDLFPETCFNEQVYEAGGKHLSYKDYATGNARKEPFSRASSKLRALMRGRSEKVDGFLDMLEKGAFDALNRKVLQAIQINISEKADQPSHVVESYTFTFSYQAGPDGGKILNGVSMQDPTGAELTVKSIRYALQMLIRRLIALCQTLPELPARRYLHMQLYYTEDCDRNYEPPGFSPCNDFRIWFAQHKGWSKQTDDCGVLDAGYHAVSLKVSHLHQSLSVELAAAKGNQMNTQLPSGLLYNVESSGQDDIDISIGERVAQRKRLQRQTHEIRKVAPNTDHTQNARTGSSSENTLPEIMDLDDDNTVDAMERITLMDKDEAAPTSSAAAVVTDSSLSTQTKEDLAARQHLLKLLVPSPQAENLEETQVLEDPHAQARVQDLVPQMPKLQLCDNKMEELENRKAKVKAGLNRQEKSRLRSSQHTLSDDASDIIDCQCGHNDEEDDMVHCHFCGRWQHVVCYGYQGVDDSRMPEIHACYKCLLQEKEAPLLRELEHLTLLRKGAQVIIDHGYDNDRTFSEALHCDIQTASKVAKHLRTEGFLVRTPGSHQKGFRQTGKPNFSFVQDGTERARMMRAYFDPTTRIAHHFENPKVLPETSKTTQYPLPPVDTAMGEAFDSTLKSNHEDHNNHYTRITDSYDSCDLNNSRKGPATPERAKSSRKPPSQELRNGFPQYSLRSTRKIGDCIVLSPREANSLTTIGTPTPLGKRNRSREQDEPKTPAMARKKLRSSRASIVHVGRSPTQSIYSDL